MIDVKDATYPQRAKELLNELRIGSISMQQFLEKCAYWGMEFVEDYRFKPLPTKPSEIVEFSGKRKEDASYEMKPEFWRVPHIYAYVEQARKIDGENRGNIGKLKMILAGLPKSDTEAREKVLRVLNEFHNQYGEIVQEAVPQMSMEEVEEEFFNIN